MIAALDVSYDEARSRAAAACVLFSAFTDAAPAATRVAHLDHVAPYEPGAFYKRELPCLLAVLALAPSPLEVIVVDGYVWLSADERPGLGAHLHDALSRVAPVVGVAKTSFRQSPFAEPVLRGGSAKPLYVTAAGVDAKVAAGWVQSMAGPHRIPTLLKLVDRLCRDAAGC